MSESVNTLASQVLKLPKDIIKATREPSALKLLFKTQKQSVEMNVKRRISKSYICWQCNCYNLHPNYLAKKHGFRSSNVFKNLNLKTRPNRPTPFMSLLSVILLQNNKNNKNKIRIFQNKQTTDFGS